MKREVFSDPSVVALADDYLWVMIDIDRQLTLSKEWKVEGVPLTYVLDPQGDTRRKLLGLVGPAQLRDELTGVLETLDQPSDYEPEAWTPE